MNILFINTRHNTVKTAKSRTVLTGEKGSKKHDCTLKDTLMKKHTALQQNIQKTTHALNLDAI